MSYMDDLRKSKPHCMLVMGYVITTLQEAHSDYAREKKRVLCSRTWHKLEMVKQAREIIADFIPEEKK